MPKIKGPFKVLGRFNSSRTPEVIYTVKEHLDVPEETGKRISCSCPGWRFSISKRGFYACKHTEHVKLYGSGLIDDKVNGSLIAKTVIEAKNASPSSRLSMKFVLAQALDESGVHLSDVAFRKLLKKLRPYLRAAKPEGFTPLPDAPSSSTSTVETDDILRVITLD
jgi:hypothetical protein